MQLSECLKQIDWYMWLQWRRYASESGNVNLTNTEMEYLYALISSSPQGIRLTDLANLLGLTKASASAMVSKLEKQGYVQRQANPSDARTSHLLPTEKAFDVQKEDLNAYQQTADAVGKVLTAEELRQLHALLGKVCDALWSAETGSGTLAGLCIDPEKI
jgi:DNA-binding MarR family transcriptional regulator